MFGLLKSWRICDLWSKSISKWKGAGILSFWWIAKSAKGCIVGWLIFLIDQDLWFSLISQIESARRS